VASARKDKRRAEIDRFLKAQQDLGVPGDLPPAEQALWVICARHGTREGADKALAALRKTFVDLNECRVAKKSELGAMLRRHVKNDSYRVGEQVRGVLWRFHRDHHTMDYGVVEELTLPQLRKYLETAEEFNREMALALFFHYCEKERAHRAAVEAAESNGEERPKKRTDRELASLADRLRMLCTIAVYGEVPSKAKAATAHRHIARAWKYAPLSSEKKNPGKKAATKKKTAKKAPAAKKKAPAARKKTATKKKAKKTAAKKTTSKKKASSRGGGTSRPKTTRSKKRTPNSRRSSRR